MAAFGPGELQQRVLELVAEAGPIGLPTTSLAKALGIPAKRVSKAAASLIDRRYLVRARIGVYEATASGRAALASDRKISSGPIDKNATVLARFATNGFRDRLWTSMRLRGRFTIRDVVSDAEAGEKDAVNDAGRYIRILAAAGYIREEAERARGTRPGSNGYKRFCLVKNTGPRAPLHRSKIGVLHDFNRGEDVPCVLR